MASRYIPSPIDVSAVVVSDSLQGLLERLAENVHDTWAARRLSEGWRYGPNRDDHQKTHPCLVPYSDLPEEEKEFDRQTARMTLSALLALGYRIEEP